ncbi:GNAT family N-acetyltransferase [Mucilaginibacter ginsenosidivorans]|uniref:GNAT family N-acetyltransferase n=1 Tax=Mucilaginibacter ginsenosidivorans TaxID=398053 RepID=A0A5B8UUG8_9SPHI|nr:GNAT family N-acetyltransferase [Mucilaginibacter ginsenosidivorans]QEC62415.1 GNAT family N-acetyltransferase [Mucilaginibacter ginsenosidivorans]
MQKVKAEPIDPSKLTLKAGQGQNLHDHNRGKYWHIHLGDVRVGKIYIDFLENEVLGNHPSIDIFINKEYQGRHIGRYAYNMACEQSGLNRVYMHTRKSNIASIRAAEEAGFKEVVDKVFRQVVMVWEK